MKHSIPFLLAFTATLILSCNNTSEKPLETSTSEDTSKPVENKVMIPTSACYFSTTSKDTVQLKVEVFPNVVTGKLMYKFYQKDGNNGNFDGIMKGDTLIADYTFMSEGKSSVRQVAFLIKDTIAVEGYGAMEEKEGKMVFKNTKDLTFGKGVSLKKIECGAY